MGEPDAEFSENVLEACRITPVHKLPDFRRSQVSAKQTPIMFAETTAKPNQPVPML